MKKKLYILTFFAVAILNFNVNVYADHNSGSLTTDTAPKATRSSELNSTEKRNISSAQKVENFRISNKTDTTKNAVEQYEEISKNFKALSITELKEIFTDTASNIEWFVYIGRSSCHYCREFAPSLNDFNKLIRNQLLYFNISDRSSPEYQYAFNVVGISGTPATLRIKNGQVISAWIGNGKTGKGLYNEIFSEIADLRAASIQHEDNIVSNKEKMIAPASDVANNSVNNSNSDQNSSIVYKNAQLTSQVVKNKSRYFTPSHTIDKKHSFIAKTKNTGHESLPQTGEATSHILGLGSSFVAFALFISQKEYHNEKVRSKY